MCSCVHGDQIASPNPNLDLPYHAAIPSLSHSEIHAQMQSDWDQCTVTNFHGRRFIAIPGFMYVHSI